jgi:hypothetical protein
MREVFRSFAHTRISLCDRAPFSPRSICAFRGESGAARIKEKSSGEPARITLFCACCTTGAYAGASAFGRTRTTKTADGKVPITDVPRPEWEVLVKDAHVGYIRWEDFERKAAQLAMNSQASAPERFSPPRAGPALLQGLLLCGRCGERMTVRSHQRAGSRIVPDYLCETQKYCPGARPLPTHSRRRAGPGDWSGAQGAGDSAGAGLDSGSASGGDPARGRSTPAASFASRTGAI